MAEAQEEKWYRVCLNTIVRAGEELDSERLRILPMGSRVCVVQKSAENGRRVRIKSPISGWCSMSSSNGDTILAAIEDPNEVPKTPKALSAKVDALKNRSEQTRKLLEDKTVKEKDEEALKQELRYHQSRAAEAERQVEEKKAVYQNIGITISSGDKVEKNHIILCKDQTVGVVRWIGKNPDTDQDLLGMEVQMGAGDSDGTYNQNKGGNKMLFEKPVKPASAIFTSPDNVDRILSPIDILSRLEDKIAELAATKQRYFDLAKKAQQAGIALDENEG